jgi:hypothetical protein
LIPYSGGKTPPFDDEERVRRDGMTPSRSGVPVRMTKYGWEYFAVTQWEYRFYLEFVFGTFRFYEEYSEKARIRDSHITEPTLEYVYERVGTALREIVHQEIEKSSFYMLDWVHVRKVSVF